MSALSALPKRILIWALLLRGVFGASSAIAGMIVYTVKETTLHLDPGETSPVHSRVRSGAPFEVGTCGDDGWCFGRAFGSSEGWIRSEDLDFLLPEAPELSSGDASPQRKYYFVLGNDLMKGSGALTSSDGTLLKISEAWHLSAGAGRHWSVGRDRRLDAEVLFGHVVELRKTRAGAKLSSNGVWLGYGVRTYGPYNEFFGLGAALRVLLRLGTPSKNFEKRPSHFLIAIGPLITHEIGLVKPKLVGWRPQIAFNSGEIFFGLGLDLVF
jgi:hypothetical protein